MIGTWRHGLGVRGFWMMGGGSAVADDLDDAIRDTGFAYTRTGTGSYLVVFDAVEASEVSSWPVVIRMAGEGDWILVHATMLEVEGAESFPLALLRRALAYNAQTAGSKLAIDATRGDLDVQYEIPTEALTPSVLERIVNDVAVTCDTQHDTYQNMARRADP